MNIELSDALLDAVLKVGKMSSCDRVLVIGGSVTERLRGVKKKLVFATSEPHRASEIEAAGYQVVVIPGFTQSRTDRLKAALVSAVSAGLIERDDNILCAVAREEGGAINTVMHLTADEEEERHSSLVITEIDSTLPPQLLEVVVNLSLRIGREGYEGRPIGTLIVVGDSTKVMEKSHPLTLNPFQGYSEAERNLYDPQVRDAVRTFAMLDGAFVVRDDAVVLAAGRHIRVDEPPPGLRLGMGARHTAAAAISMSTDAIAVAVSQSSGEVRVFRNGKIILEIAPSGRRADQADVSKLEVKVKTPKRKSTSKKKKSTSKKDS